MLMLTALFPNGEDLNSNTLSALRISCVSCLTVRDLHLDLDHLAMSATLMMTAMESLDDLPALTLKTSALNACMMTTVQAEPLLVTLEPNSVLTVSTITTA